MSNLLLIFIYLMFGYIFSNTSFFRSNIPNILNKLVIYMSLPAMILLQIPKLEISIESMIPVIIAWIVIFSSAVLVLLLSKYFKFSKEIQGVLLLLAPLGNTSFLGIPIIQSYYGDDAIPYVLLYDQFGSFIALVTYGTFIVSYYSNAAQISIKSIAIKLFTFPPFISLLLAFTLIGVTYNQMLENILYILANTIVPFAVIAVGMQLQLILPKNDIKPLSIALFIKIIISPTIAVIVCMLFGWQGEIANISIMESGMAPMIVAGTMASLAGISPRLISAVLGYGILFSFITTYILYRIL